jgi:putative sterol carrier protein
MTAAELITTLPSRLKPGEGTGIDIVYHFKISGPRGGDFTVTVNDGVCKAEAGLHGEPKCVVEAADSDYEDVEYGRTNAQMAVLLGKVKVSNIASMLKFVGMFDRVS